MRILTILLFSLLVVLTSCSSPEPKEISYGERDCANCMMTITDRKFGAEAVSNTGKVYEFDAIECMLGWYLAEEEIKQSDVHSLWVTDFSNPGSLIDARTAFFAKSEDVHSPMSLNVASFASQTARDEVIGTFENCTTPSFDEVLTYSEDYQ